MKDLPRWVKEILDDQNLTCGKCNNAFVFKDLFAIGIEKSSKKPHKEVLFLGIICKKCGEMTNFELQEMTLLDLAFEVLEDQSQNQSDQNKQELDTEMGIKRGTIKPKKTRSKITLKEIKDHADFLKNVKTHEEFLVALGMSLDEIEKYNIKKKKKKK